jgi:hypothetical protein
MSIELGWPILSAPLVPFVISESAQGRIIADSRTGLFNLTQVSLWVIQPIPTLDLTVSAGDWLREVLGFDG